MFKVGLGLLALTLVGGAASAFLLPGSTPYEIRSQSALKLACADQIRRTTVSPSTFKVVGARFFDAPIGQSEIDEEILEASNGQEAAEARVTTAGTSEYYEAERDKISALLDLIYLDEAKRAFADGREPSVRHVELRFDAANSYGAALRHHAYCTFRDYGGNWSGLEPDEVELVGTDLGEPPTVDEILAGLRSSK